MLRLLLVLIIVLFAQCKTPENTPDSKKQEVKTKEEALKLAKFLLNYRYTLRDSSLVSPLLKDTVLFSGAMKKWLYENVILTRLDSMLIRQLAYQEGRSQMWEEFAKADSLRHPPVVIVDHIDFNPEGYLHSIFFFSGIYNIDYCKIVLNPASKSGGYYYNCDEPIKGGVVKRLHPDSFFNADGQKFNLKNKIVDLVCEYSLSGSSRIDTTEFVYIFD